MGRTSAWLLFALAVLLFLASLTIHVATYFDLPLTERWPFLWLVYFLGIILFGVVLADAQARTGAKGKAPMFTACEPRYKPWAEAVAKILLVYALAVVVIWLVQPVEGNTTRINGRPVVTEHGQVIRQLDEGEYAHIKATEFRGISALLLSFVGWDVLELTSLVILEERKRATRAANQNASLTS